MLYSPADEYNKTEIFKMAASRFVEVTDKEISEINSVPKNTKDLCKNTKTIIRLRLAVITYQGIFTSTSSRRIFPIITSPSANNC